MGTTAKLPVLPGQPHKASAFFIYGSPNHSSALSFFPLFFPFPLLLFLGSFFFISFSSYFPPPLLSFVLPSVHLTRECSERHRPPAPTGALATAYGCAFLWPEVAHVCIWRTGFNGWALGFSKEARSGEKR